LNDLIYIFFTLELYALASYILIGYKGKFTIFSGESAIKYFLIGTIFSIIMVYGIALIYLTTGLTFLHSIEVYLSYNSFTTPPLVFGYFNLYELGTSFLLIGLLFKLAAAPFHF